MNHILIVEDEIYLQKALLENLSSKGYTADTAVNGEDALEKIKIKKPDLILLDLLMPKMDGFEVLRVLKANEQTEHIPVIVLTNVENSKDIAKTIELGATTYLVKVNYSLDDLMVKVQEALIK